MEVGCLYMSESKFPEGHKTLSQLHIEDAALAEKLEKKRAKSAAAARRKAKRRAKAISDRKVHPDVTRVLKRMDDAKDEFIASSPE